ncbi:MAG: hypothetical protein NZL92_11975, partial [Gloeomargarita sp. SKYG116]|nr:hypothetical protein [Gloeomargarita sp. SKYG116]MDW8402396.1 hypothetical protein [Gloeomargarita sp. SKYGB_i_bin116]
MDNLGHWWTLAGVALFIVEIFSAGFVLGSLAFACLTTAIFAYIGFPIEVQRRTRSRVTTLAGLPFAG